MADGFVQAPPDAGGKKVDSTEQLVNNITIERLRVAVPDDVTVSGDALEAILFELRVKNKLIAEAMGLTDQLDALRNDAAAAII